MAETAMAVCATCGMPVRVDFDDDGEIVKVFAFCDHIQYEPKSLMEEVEDE